MELLEREGVLRELLALVDRARHGDGHVVLLRGEAGIGKTAVASALEQAVAGSVRVMWGACDDLLAARPLGPVWDMAAAEPALEEALAADDRRLVQHGLIDVLTRAHVPTVAIFEDVHWADGATLDLLTLVGRRVARSHTLIVMTLRDVPSDHSLRIVLGDLPRGQVASFHLQPLSRHAVATVVPDAAVARHVHEITGGNPFFVSALVAQPDDRVPATVRDLVGSLVARLMGKAERLVDLLAVVPGGTEIDLVDEIDSELMASANAGVDLGLLRMHGETVEFRHELVRTAVLAGLPEPVRRDLHRDVLVAGERLGHDVARLAHHARHGHDVDAMVRVLPEAARQAAAERSHREAITHLEALEPHLDQLPMDQRADLHELRATEELFASGTGLRHAMAAIELRRQLDDAAGMGAGLVCAARSAWAGGDVAHALELANEAVAVLDHVGGDDLARAHAELGRMAAQSDDQWTALRHAEQALALAPAPSAARVLGLTTAGFVTNLVSYPEGSCRLEEAAQLAESLGLAWELQRARGNLIESAMDAKDFDEARRINDAALASEDTDLLTNKFHLLVQADIDTAVGDYATADRVLGELGARDHLTTALQWVANESRANLQVRSGDVGAGAAVERLWDRPPVPGQAWPWTTPATITAQFLWVFQQDDAEVTGRCRVVLAQNVGRARPWAVAELALWLWLGGHLAEIPGRAAAPVRWLGRGEWQRAADWFADRGMPFEQAVALSRGDTPARIEGLRTAHVIGARALAARMRATLRADGVTSLPRGPRHATSANPFGLTPRQAEVLGLVSQGRSNAEIAERMFLSVRTVENHVSAILSRLDAADRTEAAAMMVRAGQDE